MPSGTRLRPNVLAGREQIQAARRQARELHQRGADAVKVCSRLTSLVDEAIVALFEAALAEQTAGDADRLRSRVALVAHGGYGRRQLAPFSDIDLMILHDGPPDEPIAKLAQRLTQDIFDIGLQLGQSVRTPAQAVRLARQDAVIGTSLIESRLLVGAAALHESFVEQFNKSMERRSAAVCRAFIDARAQERQHYGETVYLLEPNIKRSRGGLRDLHLLRWLWYVKSGVTEPDRLHAMGVISKFDYRRLISSRSFLLRVRNEMHFHAQSSQDMLTRAEQLRLAGVFGVNPSGGLLPVEQFMRDYFHHTNHIWRLAHRLSELVQPTSRMTRALEPVFARAIKDEYRLGLREISATQLGQGRLKARLDEVLRLVDLARLHDKWIDQETWYLVYRNAPTYSSEPVPEVTNRFLEIIANPLKLGDLLRKLHELGVLEKIVPEMAHARCLLQFNQYHKYTVDEHSIRAVDEATRFRHRRDTLGETYRRLEPKRTLHLALLLHDLGKGHQQDHSELGLEIARHNAARLELPADETETLAFLVHRHLRMSHLAFRRDTSQQQLVDLFADEVGTPERLAMLYLMTCADLAAVGPGVLNSWKIEVLTELYEHTLEALGADAPPESRGKRDRLLQETSAMLSPGERIDPWFKKQFRELPEGFLAGRTPRQLAQILTRLRGLAPRSGVAWGQYLAETDTTEFIAGVDQGGARGIFFSMAGVLSAHGLEIFSAETATLRDGLLLLRYVAHDTEHNGEPPPERIAEISSALVEAIDGEKAPRFRNVWGCQHRESTAALSNQPSEVRLDTHLSDECAIVEVFTVDRSGLLYDLARALHHLDLTIRFAKIGTYLDQVVDVFYVCERDGRKPQDEARLAEIQSRLMKVIERESHG